jgi:hypothetical protein
MSEAQTSKKPFKLQISGSSVIGGYIIIGFVIALVRVSLWQWGVLSFFSPSFYQIVIFWPFYIIGLIQDISRIIWENLLT